MQKRGQITVFIIVGLLILALAAIIFYTRDSVQQDEIEDISSIKIFVEECIGQTAELGILVAGLQGGYIQFDETILGEPTFYGYTSYWFDDGDVLIPAKETIESQLADYIEADVDEQCLNGFESIPKNIIAEEIDVDVSINNENVVITAVFPVTLVDGEIRQTVSDFRVELPVRLGMMLDQGRVIVELEKENPGEISINALANMLFPVNYYIQDDDILIYELTDEESTVVDEPLVLIFANSLEVEQGMLEIDPLDDLIVQEGELVEFYVTADGENLLFTSSSNLFVIHEDGLVSFTPDDLDVGFHSNLVAVTDGKDSDRAIFDIIVEGVNDNAPELTFLDNEEAAAGYEYSSFLRAFDEDEDDLTFSLVDGPTGLEVGEDGSVSWMPSSLGVFTFTAGVSDGLHDSTKEFKITVVEESAPVLPFIGDRMASEGEEFIFNAAATDDDPIYYYDDTDLFEIDQEGMIRFTPGFDMVGEYVINIYATDGIATSSQEMRLIIS